MKEILKAILLFAISISLVFSTVSLAEETVPEAGPVAGEENTAEIAGQISESEFTEEAVQSALAEQTEDLPVTDAVEESQPGDEESEDSGTDASEESALEETVLTEVQTGQEEPEAAPLQEEPQETPTSAETQTEAQAAPADPMPEAETAGEASATEPAQEKPGETDPITEEPATAAEAESTEKAPEILEPATAAEAESTEKAPETLEPATAAEAETTEKARETLEPVTPAEAETTEKGAEALEPVSGKENAGTAGTQDEAAETETAAIQPDEALPEPVLSEQNPASDAVESIPAGEGKEGTALEQEAGAATENAAYQPEVPEMEENHAVPDEPEAVIQEEQNREESEAESVPTDVASAAAVVMPEQDILSAESAAPAADPSEEADVLPASDFAGENSTRGFVYRLYHIILQREPEPEGMAYWTKLLDSGEFTAADAVNGFFNSVEYQIINKNNEAIVTDCYNTLLNRDPDPEGFKFWKNRLDVGMTTQSIIHGFVESNEFTALAEKYGLVRGDVPISNPLDINYDRTSFVYRMYKNCLGREPDREGEEFWCRNLANGMTGVEVASGFFFSKEFNQHRYDNGEFVELLYKTILGREYDIPGKVDWTTKLNYTESREKVLNGFMGSIEFGKQCERAQIVAGAPMETPDESDAWKYNIEVLRLCNQQRRLAGVGDLFTREDLLWDLATLRAREITQYFDHVRPDGTSCFTAFKQQGFYGWLGENLAGGQQDPNEVVNAWMNSEGHRANILNKNYTYLATGHIYDTGATTYCGDGKYKGQYVSFGHYWAQSFCNFGVSIN